MMFLCATAGGAARAVGRAGMRTPVGQARAPGRHITPGVPAATRVRAATAPCSRGSRPALGHERTSVHSACSAHASRETTAPAYCAAKRVVAGRAEMDLQHDVLQRCMTVSFKEQCSGERQGPG